MKIRLIEELDNIGNELTPEQSNFFKYSKVRNSSGDLLVCYRGTKYVKDRTGFSGDIKWFSTDYDYSKKFSLGDDSIVYSAYLNCKKIFNCGNTDGRLFKVYPVVDPRLTDTFLDILRRLNVSEQLFRKIFKDELIRQEAYRMYIYQIVRNSKFKNLVERSGYDCIKTYEEDNHLCFGVFENTQIKLINNLDPIKDISINESYIREGYGRQVNNSRILKIYNSCIDKLTSSEFKDLLGYITLYEDRNLSFNGKPAAALTTSFSIDGKEIHHIITLDSGFILNNVPDELIKPIILHEIAHIIERNILFSKGEFIAEEGVVKFNDGHDGEWRKIADRLESMFNVDIDEIGGPEYSEYLS